jgi:cytochrome c peroxidase
MGGKNAMSTLSMIASSNEQHVATDPVSEIEYHLVVAEFDALWGRPYSDANRRRMDHMICVIAAFEESRGKLSAS